LSIVRARELRKSMTPPELRLWNALSTRPDGFKFRRQHSIRPYILDFFCFEAALAIEVDGMAHSMGDNPSRDERRDAWLVENGVLTVRFAAIDIRDNLEGVVALIVDRCRARSGRQ
jgi:very-short-patch-repair endonuclease